MKFSLTKEFITYVFLNILGQMAYSCYTLADTYFVSAKLGTDGLTALNLAFPMFCLMNGIGLMLGIGGGAKYSICKSRKESDTGNRIFTTALYLAVFLAAIFFCCGLFFSEPLVRLLGADQSIFGITNIYLKVMLLFAPAFIINTLLQGFIRNDGCPSLSMKAMFFGSFSNIILDYIFIFPLDMGIFGAIFATGLAPIISILILSPYFWKKKNHFHIVPLKAEAHIVREIVSSGTSPLLTEATSGIVMLLFNFIMLRLAGNIGVAAFGIVTVISLVTVAIYTGLSQGVQPLLSKYHGFQNEHHVAAIFQKAMITMLLLSGVIYCIIFFGADALAAVFNSEGDALLQQYAVIGLKIYFIACPFMGFNIVMSTYFISTERPGPAQIISLLRGFFLLIPFAFLLSYLFQMTGVWAAYPATECAVCIVGIFLYRAFVKRRRIQ
ncbi:MAG: MATE family efflux transporter [Agathobaculum sp.]|uniref:MATE family efflux transporter n=1 Tax=Agathobaculum sp. TaxID=2048138 RepID=UPI003D935D0B